MERGIILTKYTVYYATEYGSRVRSLPYGELTDFKIACQKKNWKITKIVSTKDGITKTQTF